MVTSKEVEEIREKSNFSQLKRLGEQIIQLWF
jgi:hypothetical protein